MLKIKLAVLNKKNWRDPGEEVRLAAAFVDSWPGHGDLSCLIKKTGEEWLESAPCLNKNWPCLIKETGGLGSRNPSFY